MGGCNGMPIATGYLDTGYWIQGVGIKPLPQCKHWFTSPTRNPSANRALHHKYMFRAGRCRAGICYHLFSRARYACMMDYQQPEILRLQLHVRILLEFCIVHKCDPPPRTMSSSTKYQF